MRGATEAGLRAGRAGCLTSESAGWREVGTDRLAWGLDGQAPAPPLPPAAWRGFRCAPLRLGLHRRPAPGRDPSAAGGCRPPSPPLPPHLRGPGLRHAAAELVRQLGGAHAVQQAVRQLLGMVPLLLGDLQTGTGRANTPR